MPRIVSSLNTISLTSSVISAVGMPRIAIEPPWAMLSIAARMRRLGTGHLEGHVEPLDHAQLALDVGEVALARVDRDRRAHPHRQLAADRVGLRDHDIPGARVADDGRRHEPDRAGAGDQHVLAEDRERERGVDRVPERVEDRRDLLVDPRPSGARCWSSGSTTYSAKAPSRSTPRPNRVGAQVAPARQAVAAQPAGDVALAADDVAGLDVVDVGADLDDLADELVADDERRHGSSSPPTRPTRRCGGPCRRCRSGGPGSGRR